MKPKTKAAASVRVQPHGEDEAAEEGGAEGRSARSSRETRPQVLQPADRRSTSACAKMWWGLPDRRHRDARRFRGSAARWSSPRWISYVALGLAYVLHHRRAVRGLLEDPQGAPRLSGRDEGQEDQRRSVPPKSSRRRRSGRRRKRRKKRPPSSRRSAACCSGFRLPGGIRSRGEEGREGSRQDVGRCGECRFDRGQQHHRQNQGQRS